MKKRTERRARRWCVMDLVTDPVTHRLSETKISALAIKVIFAWAFVYQILHGPVTTELWFVVGTMFIAHEAWSRIASAKFIGPNASSVEEPKKE